MKILLSVVLTLAFGFLPAAADECFRNAVGDDLHRRLAGGALLEHTFRAGDDLELFPNVPLKARVSSQVVATKPTIGVELLTLYKPRARDKGADEMGSMSETQHHLAIYNILRSTSTLKGIEYYSASRKRMRTYFHDAYTIASPEDRTKIADQLVTSIPQNDTGYAWLSDSSLGQYAAAVEYHYHYDYFAMSISNVTTVWQFIIPLAQPGGLNMLVLIVPCDEEFLLYGLVFVDTPDAFGLAQAKIASFYNRLKALFAWFKVHYERATSGRTGS